MSLFPFGDVRDADFSEMNAERLTTTLDEVRQHPTFRNHAAAFTSAIGMAVESLDDWDGDLTATLLQLGRMHSETEGFSAQRHRITKKSLHTMRQKQHFTVQDTEGSRKPVTTQNGLERT